MNQSELEQGIQKLLDFYKQKQAALQNIKRGLNQEGEERKLLDYFLVHLGIEITDETRFIAYSRMVGLHEDNLKSYLEKAENSKIEVEAILHKAYRYVEIYHGQIFVDIINYTEENHLVSGFYLEIIKGVFQVGQAMNQFHLVWTDYIINTLNAELEVRFDDDKKSIMNFLSQNDLFDKGHGGEGADRSYSTLLKDENGEYKKVSYSEAFPQEVQKIIFALDIFIGNLGEKEDKIYGKNQSYIDYLEAIKIAFAETHTDSLVERWAAVDVAWMSIDTPFQIVHPLEYYEDIYRKSVAVEWDLRIVDTSILQSSVKQDVEDMYETLYEEIGREKYQSSYEYSLKNINRVGLYISHPVFYYGSELCGLSSAQVVPNDDVVSQSHGKKIYAFPNFVLEAHRNAPDMKLTHEIFQEDFLQDYKNILSGDEKIYFDIYDIETIGHEFGHTLWLDLGNEAVMNQTGQYKNIEEFKATMGGLVAYFMKENRNLDYQTLVIHAYRCIKLLKYREVEDVAPYYCEALIHLDVLFTSGILSFDGKKLHVNYSVEDYSKLIELYISTYKKLILLYLEKQDAGMFLSEYTTQKGKIFLPKREYVREFVEHYYARYLEIGNEIL